jgi:hypothetical protein
MNYHVTIRQAAIAAQSSREMRVLFQHRRDTDSRDTGRRDTGNGNGHKFTGRYPPHLLFTATVTLAPCTPALAVSRPGNN